MPTDDKVQTLNWQETKMMWNPEILGKKEISPCIKVFVHPVNLATRTGFQDIDVKYDNLSLAEILLKERLQAWTLNT